MLAEHEAHESERDLFGERPAVKKEFEALRGVARQDRVIGDHDDSHTRHQVEAPLHEQKTDLRERHRALVGQVARKTGADHRTINSELCKRTGGPIDRATMNQLKKRLWLLEGWKDKGRIE